MKNVERVRRTRKAILEAARAAFAERGYADTSTEAILVAAGVTRGALYHHFPDKAAVFEAVCAILTEEARAAVDAAVAGVDDPVAALEAGAVAWIGFMLSPGVQHILVVDGPSVLGWARWSALDQEQSFAALAEGVAEALAAGALRFDGGAPALAAILNGAMNDLVLRAGNGADFDPQAAIVALIRALAAPR